MAFETLGCVLLAIAVLVHWTGIRTLTEAQWLGAMAWQGFQALGLATPW